MLTTITHRAMAAEFAVLLAESDAHLVEPAFEALELLDRIEAELTIYRTDSDVSRINAAAGESAVEVSPACFELIRRSVQWSRRTRGAFDISAGPLVQAWGFTAKRGKKPSDSEIQSALERVGYQHIELDSRRQTVFLAHQGMQLNLGAIGKGHALDQLTQSLLSRGLQHFLIHGGGSSIIAQGNQHSDEGPGWAVGISHPTKPSIRLGGIRMVNQALSTSGSGKQFFHHRGKRMGHVIDPRTGYPAGELLALTAVGANATDAEAASTAFFVEGVSVIEAAVEAAQGVENALPELIGIHADGRQDAVRVQAFGPIRWIDRPEGIGED